MSYLFPDRETALRTGFRLAGRVDLAKLPPDLFGVLALRKDIAVEQVTFLELYGRKPVVRTLPEYTLVTLPRVKFQFAVGPASSLGDQFCIWIVGPGVGDVHQWEP